MKGSKAAPVIALQFLKMAAGIKVCACSKLQFRVLVFLSKLWSFTLVNNLQEYWYICAVLIHYLRQVYIHGNIKKMF